MPDRITRYVDNVPQIEIAEGLVHFQQPDGTDKRVMPLAVFRATYRLMGAVLANYDTRPKSATVVPLDGRRPKRH